MGKKSKRTIRPKDLKWVAGVSVIATGEPIPESFPVGKEWVRIFPSSAPGWPEKRVMDLFRDWVRSYDAGEWG